MASPTPPPMPPGKGPGLLKNLNPKQKRMVAVVGVGAFLALIFLLSRRSAAPEAPQAGEATPNAGGATEAFGAPVAAGGTDPTAFLGAQSEVLGSRLEEVSGGLQEVGGGLAEVGSGLGSVERGQEQLGDTFMRAREADEQEFGRVQAGLAAQSRQLQAIRKKLQAGNGRRPGRGNKGGDRPPKRRGGSRKGGGRKPPRKQQRRRGKGRRR